MYWAKSALSAVGVDPFRLHVHAVVFGTVRVHVFPSSKDDPTTTPSFQSWIHAATRLLVFAGLTASHGSHSQSWCSALSPPQESGGAGSGSGPETRNSGLAVA